MKKFVAILTAALLFLQCLPAPALASNPTSRVRDLEMELDFSFGTRTGIYTGQVNDDRLPDGKGVFTSSNADAKSWTYEGEWVNGHFDGYGTTVWSSGITFSGYFSNDVYHGEGVEAYPDGSRYDGMFWDNDNSIGEYFSADGTCTPIVYIRGISYDLDILSDILSGIEEVAEISPSSSPTASPVPTALASDGDNTTERIFALEFCELYTKRIMEFNEEYGKNMGGLDTSVIGPFAAFDWGDRYGADCSGGFLNINKDDLTIESLTTAIIDVDADEKEGHNVVINALLIISALEMSDLEEEGIEMMHDIDPSQPENAFKKYLDEYTNILHPALSANADKLEAGEKILVYQGNYDYYARYQDYSDTGRNVYLIAEARE